MRPARGLCHFFHGNPHSDPDKGRARPRCSSRPSPAGMKVELRPVARSNLRLPSRCSCHRGITPTGQHNPASPWSKVEFLPMTRSLLVGEVRTFFADSSTDEGDSYPKYHSAWQFIKAMQCSKCVI